MSPVESVVIGIEIFFFLISKKCACSLDCCLLNLLILDF